METKKSSKKLLFLPPAILLVVTLIFTVLIKTVDVGTFEPSQIFAADWSTTPSEDIPLCDLKGASAPLSIGFSSLNLAFFKRFGFSSLFYKATELLGVLPFATILGFLALGVHQLFKRKSLKKISPELLCLAGFYVAVFAVYILFEKLALNFRPVVFDCGDPEASFPSSHTFFALALCGSAIFALTRLYKSRFPKLVLVANVALSVLAVAITLGRLFSGVHWLTDILGGVLYATLLLSCLLAAFGLCREPVKSNKPAKSD